MYLLSHARVAAITHGEKLSKVNKTSISIRASAAALLEKRV